MVENTVDKYLLKFSAIAGVLFLFIALILFLAKHDSLSNFSIAYLMSFIFTGSNFLVMRKVDLHDQSRFTKIFGISLAVRFLLVIAALIFMLKALNNHQIFFTVSFIISYICHSVIEIIFLNKILETDTKK